MNSLFRIIEYDDGFFVVFFHKGRPWEHPVIEVCGVPESRVDCELDIHELIKRRAIQGGHRNDWEDQGDELPQTARRSHLTWMWEESWDVGRVVIKTIR